MDDASYRLTAFDKDWTLDVKRNKYVCWQTFLFTESDSWNKLVRGRRKVIDFVILFFMLPTRPMVTRSLKFTCLFMYLFASCYFFCPSLHSLCRCLARLFYHFTLYYIYLFLCFLFSFTNCPIMFLCVDMSHAYQYVNISRYLASPLESWFLHHSLFARSKMMDQRSYKR